MRQYITCIISNILTLKKKAYNNTKALKIKSKRKRNFLRLTFFLLRLFVIICYVNIF